MYKRILCICLHHTMLPVFGLLEFRLVLTGAWCLHCTVDNACKVLGLVHSMRSPCFLDINEAGEVTDRLCHMIVCLWLAKECGRCVHFWCALPNVQWSFAFCCPGQ